MLIRLDDLKPWKGEPVIYETDIADIHRRDGTVQTVKVDPYTFEVRHALNIEELWTDKELGAAGFAKPKLFVVPENKRIVGEARYVREADGSVSQLYEVENIPAPPVLTPQEKLAQAGLTPEDLKALIA